MKCPARFAKISFITNFRGKDLLRFAYLDLMTIKAHQIRNRLIRSLQRLFRSRNRILEMGCCNSKSSSDRNNSNVIYSETVEDVSYEESIDTAPLIRKRRHSQHLIELITEQSLEQDETGRSCSERIDD